jgi:hypothetical protein
MGPLRRGGRHDLGCLHRCRRDGLLPRLGRGRADREMVGEAVVAGDSLPRSQMLTVTWSISRTSP